MENRTTLDSIRRVSELLQAHAKQAHAGGTETVAGIVSATVDSHLRLTDVRLLDASIDAAKREVLERAIVEAVNGAMQQAVKSSGEALAQLRASNEWETATAEIFKGKQNA